MNEERKTGFINATETDADMKLLALLRNQAKEVLKKSNPKSAIIVTSEGAVKVTMENANEEIEEFRA